MFKNLKTRINRHLGTDSELAYYALGIAVGAALVYLYKHNDELGEDYFVITETDGRRMVETEDVLSITNRLGTFKVHGIPHE